jgi:site-specific DNA-methyltransferase (adenine-specific)
MCAYYSDKAFTLYQGDAWQVLQGFPADCVDAVITDPPYSTGAVTLAGKQAPPAVKYQNTGTVKQYPDMLGDGKDQRGFLAWAVMWLTEAWRVTRPGAPVLIFTDWRQLPTVTDALQAAGFHWRGVVVWNKLCGRPVLGEFRRDCEFIVYGSKGRYQTHEKHCLPCIYNHAVNPAKKRHISGKPLPLLVELMRRRRNNSQSGIANRAKVHSNRTLGGICQDCHRILAGNQLKFVSESAHRKEESPRKNHGLFVGKKAISVLNLHERNSQLA